MSPNLPDDALPPQPDDEIETLATQFLAQLQSSVKPDREAVVRAHPHLADRLARRLALVEMIYHLGLAPEADRPTGTGTGEASGGASLPGTRLSPSAAADNEAALPCRGPEQVPRRLGRYEVFEEIARGGMAVVLLGRDPDLNRDLALKVIRSDLADRPHLVQRFVEEARITAQLAHPGIVPVHELGQDDRGLPFLALKLVHGQTLEALLAGRATPREELPRFVGIFEQVCQALAFAHSRGILHRDLKPENVMVGRFGEVQVMDWGLAKTLEARAAPAGEGDLIPSPHSDPTAEAPGSEDRQTAEGTVLGTPAYMAPEQARGQVERLDERADVFGLGALLCEVLTGQPPYVPGEDGPVLYRAELGEVAEACTRLDSCGADAELIALAKACLSTEIDKRPRDAGVVSRQVAAYQQGVQERLRSAERERAAAQARAEESKATARAERRARRRTGALAAAVLSLVLVGGGGSAWWWQERTTRVGEVEAALAEADAYRQAGRWPEVRAALERAEGRLGGGGPRPLRDRVEQARRDAVIVAELDDIRLQQSEGRAGHFDLAAAERLYAEAFARYGIAAAELPALETGARVRDSAVREALLAGLEDWRQLRAYLGFQFSNADWAILSIVPGGGLTEDGRLQVGDRIIGVGQDPQGPMVDVRGKTARELRRLLTGRGGSVVRIQVMPAGATQSREYALVRGGKVGAWLEDAIEAADDNAWRRAFREAVAAGDTAKMQALARHAEALAQPPSVLDRLGNALRGAGLKEQGLALWRQAQQRYPGDFWLNYDLGVYLPESGRPDGPGEAVGYCRTAVALRPVAGAYNALGSALYYKGDWDGSIAAFRQVIQLDPNAATAHTNLGLALQAKGNLDDALDEQRQAVQLDPQHALAHAHLGRALQAKGNLDDALDELRRAVQLDPQNASIHSHLGFALRAKGELDGSIDAYRQATILNPQSAPDYSNLGFSLRVKGELDGSINAYRKAIQLNPQSSLEHNALGFVLKAKGELESAIDAYRQATILDPKSASFQNDLGLALQAKGDLEGAIAAYRQAIYLDPNAVYAQNNLRAARRMQEGTYWVAGALEGEKLKVLGRSSDYYLEPQEMSGFQDDQWSGDAQLYARPPKAGSWADLELPAPEAGKYEVIVYLTKAHDYGIVRFRLDGKELGKPIDCFEPEKVLRTGPLSLGTVELKKGPAVLRVEVTGSNPRSVGLRTMWGLDCVVLKPVKP